jgi:predicted Co/Zn/Cd cation transporter (cation efflux family)
MTFKEFLDKYLGLIIGVLIAIIVILLGGVYVVQCIALIVLGGWVGRYVQKNKTKVRTQLTGVIDKVLKDDDDME